ncbi:MAG: hypothetical protein AAF721_10450 [Myxococcota bacterium]
MPQGAPAPKKLEVAGTNIFARGDGERQKLVYGMNVASERPLAMVLPLPVPAGADEDAVRFIDLRGYPKFFVDLNECFPVVEAPLGRGGGGGGGGGVIKTTLKVHDAGDFEASFVPTLADIHRLDERFVLAPPIWTALSKYADWGFAVFQLRDVAAKRSRLRALFGLPRKTIHPMAIDFPRRHRDRLFFPTVHVHGEELGEHEAFDHLLFWQASAPARFEPESRPSFGDGESTVEAQVHVDMERARGLVEGSRTVHRRQLRGRLPNRDHWVFTGDPA